MDMNDDSRIDKRKRHRKNMRDRGRCTLCPPHGYENQTRTKRGTKKPKYKDKR